MKTKIILAVAGVVFLVALVLVLTRAPSSPTPTSSSFPTSGTRNTYPAYTGTVEDTTNTQATSAGAVGDTSGARVVVPIHQTLLSNGYVDYSISIMIGSQTIEAQLDTGATGIRILPGAVAAANYTLTNTSATAAYGSGVQLKGVIGNAVVTMGGQASAPIPLQVVQTVSCASTVPNCPASKVSQSDYRIGGYGLVGEGFKATVGIGLRPSSEANPLENIGSKSWILAMPPLDSGASGQLILNPTPSDIAGYTLFKLSQLSGGWADSSLQGCVTNNTTHKARCEGTLLDAGQNGVAVRSADTTKAGAFPTGTSVTLTLTNTQGQVMTLPFTVGSSGVVSSVSLTPPINGTSIINTGLLPLLSYSVWYDSVNGIIGLKEK